MELRVALAQRKWCSNHQPHLSSLHVWGELNDPLHLRFVAGDGLGLALAVALSDALGVRHRLYLALPTGNCHRGHVALRYRVTLAVAKRLRIGERVRSQLAHSV